MYTDLNNGVNHLKQFMKINLVGGVNDVQKSD